VNSAYATTPLLICHAVEILGDLSMKLEYPRTQPERNSANRRS
jgi:hypothetical protein